MRRTLLILLSVVLVPAPLTRGNEPTTAAATRIAVAPHDWPWWRGLDRNGIAAADQEPVFRWSSAENVLWKTPVPGRGHGSPTVVGDQVFLATADEQADSQSVLCFDRNTGAQIWKTEVHRGGIVRKGNEKSSQASSTVACDGERLFICFLNQAAVYTTALTRDGRQLWQTKICDYTVHQGYGSSPAIYGPLVLVSADHKEGGAIAGLDRGSGKVVWKHERPATANYASPIVLPVAGRDQLVFQGCDKVSSFEPLTGKQLWEIDGSTTECVTSPVTDGKLVFTSGGYPRNHISAVHADGSGRVAWENNVRVYVPSLLHRDGFLYGVTDAGIAMCWNSSTGQEVWKERLGGTFSASPVLVGSHLFATNEAGKTFIFLADPTRFQQTAENQLGEEVFATPTICGGRIYMRIAIGAGDQRQEFLYCLGRSAAP